MALTLRQKQAVFARLVSRLIAEAFHRGYEVTLGEAYRSPEEARRLASLGKGIEKSLHTSRLAIDLNLFKDGKYLTKSEDHRLLGEWWEMQSGQGVVCKWGGRFKPSPDGNHYSIEHGGRA